MKFYFILCLLCSILRRVSV